MLRQNLAGKAKKFMAGKCQEGLNPTAETMAGWLKARFMDDLQIFSAKEKLNNLRQKKGESVADFASRFTESMMEAGRRDGQGMASKFFKALRKPGRVAFDPATFHTVEDVANAHLKWELTDQMAGRSEGKRRREDTSSEDSTDGTTDLELEKAEKMVRRLKAKRRKAKKSKDGESSGSEESEDEDDEPEDKRQKKRGSQASQKRVGREEMSRTHLGLARRK